VYFSLTIQSSSVQHRPLIKECQEADIIIAALGQPNFVKAEMVKEGAVVIDVDDIATSEYNTFFAGSLYFVTFQQFEDTVGSSG